MDVKEMPMLARDSAHRSDRQTLPREIESGLYGEILGFYEPPVA
jgi:hypothetical protein